MAFPTNTLGILIAIVSAFALVHSAHSIPRLLKYEDKAKKAAEWSRTAEKNLWDIRYTVGTGFAGVSAFATGLRKLRRRLREHADER